MAKRKGTAPVKKARVKGEAVKPLALMELYKKLGVTELSKIIGVSTTKLHNARRYGIVSKETEIACLYATERLPDVLMMLADRKYDLENLKPRQPGGTPFEERIPLKAMLKVTLPKERATMLVDFSKVEGIELTPNKGKHPPGIAEYMAAANPDQVAKIAGMVTLLGGTSAEL